MFRIIFVYQKIGSCKQKSVIQILSKRASRISGHNYCNLFAIFFWWVSFQYITSMPDHNENPCGQTAAMLDQLKPKVSTHSHSLRLSDSSMNTHKFFRCSPQNPKHIFLSFSAITIATWPLRNTFAKEIGVWRLLSFSDYQIWWDSYWCGSKQRGLLYSTGLW